MQKRFIFLGIIIALVAIGGFFVWEGGKEAVAPTKLQVVTTFAPMYIFTVNVVGNLADVQNLLPQGAGPHDYAFQPSDVVKIAKADIVVKHGRGVDDWLDEVISTAGHSRATVITASTGIEPHTGAPILDMEQGTQAQTANEGLVKPDPSDPHIWVDPFLVIKEVEQIRDGFMKYDPDHADVYARNAEMYLLKLLVLDADIRSELSTIKKRDFIAFHPAFNYFAYEYGLREVAVIEEKPGQEPSPAELTKVVRDGQKAGVKVVFSEPQFSPKIVETLARDYGFKIVEIDPIETGELHPDYYEEVMRENVKKIVEAMK